MLCAGGNEEGVSKKKIVREDVRAIKINSVGRYAIRIQFTSGCSAGLYTFDLLRNLR